MHYSVTGRNPVFLFGDSPEKYYCRVILSCLPPVCRPVYHKSWPSWWGPPRTVEATEQVCMLRASASSLAKSQGSPWSELSASCHRPSVNFSTVQELCSVSTQSIDFLVISASALSSSHGITSTSRTSSTTGKFSVVKGLSKLCPWLHWSQAGPSVSRSLGSTGHSSNLSSFRDTRVTLMWQSGCVISLVRTHS